MRDVQNAISDSFSQQKLKNNIANEKELNHLQPEYNKNKSRVSNFANKAVQMVMSKFYWKEGGENERKKERQSENVLSF